MQESVNNSELDSEGVKGNEIQKRGDMGLPKGRGEMASSNRRERVEDACV